MGKAMALEIAAKQPLMGKSRVRPIVILEDPRKLDAALRAAVNELESAVVEQERAANRILGLTELLIPDALDERTRLRLEAIMESCAFQDIAGQRIRKVRALLRRLTTLPPGALRPIEPTEAPPPSVVQNEPQKSDALTQEEVDRLLRNE